jgi:tetratricopeptide (TPR) repeat protein
MSVAEPPLPERLGRYRVVRRVGVGGMAEVFLARSTGAEGLEKLLVVKRILPTFARSPRFLTMFVDEAKVAMRLNHPNIVQVYAFEQERDEFLLAMEFVDGLDLGRLVEAARRHQRRIPPSLAAYVAMEVAKGLDYAHRRRDERDEPLDIVHRDVSPQNVLVSYEGGVKVADFGIARARLVSEETGVIKGKFSYMSPEQARGQRVDRRSDVYALGVLLAELLMGRSMHVGRQGMEILERVRDGARTLPREVDPEVPEALDEVVRRATERDPAERFPSMRDLARALSRYLHDQDDVVDVAALERFVQEVAPPQPTGPGDAAEPPLATAAGPLPSIKDRRNVFVVHGRPAVSGEARVTGVTPAAVPVDREIRRVLDDIAFKAHAVLEWLEDEGSFRFVLGLARATVDDPLNATRLALDVLEALDGSSADRPHPLTASIGISRGAVVTQRLPGHRLHYEPVAGVFEVAAALSGPVGETWVSGEVYRLARRAFAFDEAVRTVEREDGQVIRGHRLRGARSREERAEGALAEAEGLVGRHHELEALTQLFQEVVESHRSEYLALVGDLGVGKTALVAEALRRFEPTPRVLRVEAAFGTRDLPYGAVAELVREACRIGDAPDPRPLLRRALQELLPEAERGVAFDALVGLIAPAGRPQERDPAARGAQLAQALRALLGGLARQAPLLLWIDGLQEVDTPSLEVMGRLVSRQYPVPLLLILGSRTDPRVESAIVQVPRLELGELTGEDRSTLIARRFGGAKVPADIEQAIVHRAGGNPFFVHELIDALVERGAVRVEDDRVVRTGAAFSLPTTLEDVVAARLHTLPEPQRLVLRWLAVAGAGFDSDALEPMAGSGTASVVEALIERGILLRRSGGLIFASAVVRLVVYESIEIETRSRMHREVARRLEGRRVAAARLAHHQEQGGMGPEAAASYLAAGSDAERKYSYDDAMRFFGRAIALLPEGAPDAFRAHRAREQILRALGRRKEQRHELASLRRIAEGTGDPQQLAMALCRLARFDLDGSRYEGVEAILERALDAAIRADDRRTEVEALRLLGQLRRDAGDVRGAIEALDRALDRAAYEGSLLSERAASLTQKGILLWRVGDTSRSLEASAEAVVIARRQGLRSIESHALNSLGVALAHEGSLEDAIAVVRASIALDRAIGDRYHLGRKVSNVGQMYAWLGRADLALAFLGRALLVHDIVDDRSGRADALSAMADVHVELTRDLDRAGELLEEAFVAAQGDPYDIAQANLVQARRALARGAPAEAMERAVEAARHAERGGMGGQRLAARALLAQAKAEAGDEGAMDLAQEVAADLEEGVVAEQVERVQASVARTLALLGAPERARATLAHARELVMERLGLLRDPALRDAYRSSPAVSTILQEGSLVS